MAYDPPKDLIELQRRFFELEATCGRLAQDDPDDEYEQARAERLDVVMDLYRNEWFSTVEDQYAARQALREAARTGR